jgi:hypothetical protein
MILKFMKCSMYAKVKCVHFLQAAAAFLKVGMANPLLQYKLQLQVLYGSLFGVWNSQVSDVWSSVACYHNSCVVLFSNT